MTRAPIIAIVGAGSASKDVLELSEAVGRAVAERGATVVCGGLGGVMEAAARGARAAGGHTIGILPTYDRRTANEHVEFPIATGLGEARNAVVVGCADAVIALEGEGGTLAEIGFALKLGRPVVALRAWAHLPGIDHVEAPAEAVELVFRKIKISR